MFKRVSLLLFFIYSINAQIALPTFQAVHKPQSTSSSSLYDFTSHTFTNCGATGREGPTLANCKSSYDVSWEDDTDYFNVPSDAGIQYWTVPQTATYTIEVWGAQGGNTSSATGGLGARMKGDFTISSGTVLKILVGQQGGGNYYDGGGGGGTFVVQKTGSNATDITALIIAGAGGGSNTWRSNGDNGAPGSTGTAGTHGLNNTDGTPGDNGTGGSGSYSSCGAGLLTNGEAAGWAGTNTGGGYAFVNGGMGGERISNVAVVGGFGGGGSAHGNYCIGGAGGGGYSGGTGSNSWCNSGGGGGSYNSGSNQSNSGGVREDHGQVIITKN